MPQMLRQDNIPRMLVASTTTATLAITSGGQPTLITVGGQQYQPASLLTLNAATVGANGLDAGSLGASQLWYVYAIAHQTSFAMALVASLSATPTMPSGYGTAYKLIGAFNTNTSSQISFTVTPEDGVVYSVPAAYVGGATTMDDATATRMGLKSYSHGTTYNSGIAPTISGAAGHAVQGSSFIPYQMHDGSWRLRFSWKATITGSTIVDSTVNSITGIAYEQGVNLIEIGAVPQGQGGKYLNASSGSFVLRPGTTNITSYSVHGDIALASKPTWAY